MKTIHTSLLTSLTALALCTSLATAQEAPAKPLEIDKKNLFAKGHTWQFDVTLTMPKEATAALGVDVKPTETEDGLVYKFVETQQCIGTLEIPQLKRKLPVINVFFGGKLKKRQILALEDGQLHFYGMLNPDYKKEGDTQGVVMNTPIIMASEKAVVGDKWTWKEENLGLPEFQFRCIAKDQKVTVNGTTYTADKISMNQVKKDTKEIMLTKEYWIVAGVGLVKEEEKQFIGDKTIVKTLELKSFRMLEPKQGETFKNK